MRLFKIILILILLAVVGMVGFAFLGDLSPQRSEVRIPVQMNGE
ncbi:hypothetical protein [Pseudoruegeria sp. SK021]|nr:hypothetical protein [Pseudoruegeria sp. SK021]